MKTIKITLPITQKQILQLRSGDFIELSGAVYTMRDAAHARIVRMIRNKEDLELNIKDSAIYYVGPTPSPSPNFVFGAAGPTTSDRMDKYVPLLLSKGMKIMIGKGKRSLTVVKSIEKHQALYLATIGGAGSYLADHIISSKTIAFEDLGTEAIRLLQIKDFPCIVINDSYGNDFYRGKFLSK